MIARFNGSWNEYYSFFAGRLSKARFHISMKESEETFELLEGLDYIENDLAEEIFELNIGEWGYHVHEDFDDEYNLISSETALRFSMQCLMTHLNTAMFGSLTMNLLNDGFKSLKD